MKYCHFGGIVNFSELKTSRILNVLLNPTHQGLPNDNFPTKFSLKISLNQNKKNYNGI
jgi:hypothetical protein